MGAWRAAAVERGASGGRGDECSGSDRRLPVRHGTLPYRRSPGRGALLPLPDVPAGAWRPGGRVVDRAACGLCDQRRQPRRLPVFAAGVPLVLRPLRHALELGSGRQSRALRRRDRHPRQPRGGAPTLHLRTGSRIAWFGTADRLPRRPTNERFNSRSVRRAQGGRPPASASSKGRRTAASGRQRPTELRYTGRRTSPRLAVRTTRSVL